jgi:hypothetical protein
MAQEIDRFAPPHARDASPRVIEPGCLRRRGRINIGIPIIGTYPHAGSEALPPRASPPGHPRAASAPPPILRARPPARARGDTGRCRDETKDATRMFALRAGPIMLTPFGPAKPHAWLRHGTVKSLHRRRWAVSGPVSLSHRSPPDGRNGFGAACFARQRASTRAAPRRSLQPLRPAPTLRAPPHDNDEQARRACRSLSSSHQVKPLGVRVAQSWAMRSASRASGRR